MALDWPAIERLFFDFFLLFSPQKAPKFASRAHSDNGAETTPPPHTHTHTKMPKKGKRTHPKKKVFQPKKSKGTRTTARRPFGRSPTKVETEMKKKRKNSFVFSSSSSISSSFSSSRYSSAIGPFLLSILRPALRRVTFFFFVIFFSFFLSFFFVIFQPAASIRLLTEFEIDFYRVCNR